MNFVVHFIANFVESLSPNPKFYIYENFTQ